MSEDTIRDLRENVRMLEVQNTALVDDMIETVNKRDAVIERLRDALNQIRGIAANELCPALTMIEKIASEALINGKP